SAWLDERYLGDARVKQIQYLTSLDLQTLEELDARPSFERMKLQGSTSSMQASFARVDFSDAYAAAETLSEWSQSGELWFAEPNYISHLSSENDLQADETSERKLFSDYATQYEKFNYWWLKAINLS